MTLRPLGEKCLTVEIEVRENLVVLFHSQGDSGSNGMKDISANKLVLNKASRPHCSSRIF